MFLNKVHDQKVELMRAIFRNMYLKEKEDYLDSECKMLAENLISGQVIGAKTNDSKIALENELEKLRSLQDQRMHELSVSKERILSMSMLLEDTKSSVLSSLGDNKSMKEELEIKNDMIKCLQAELVHVRLKVAEQWAMVKELKQIKDELDGDKDMLTSTKPETIARLQEEVMTSKLLETQYSLEFDKIKKYLEQMKTELTAHKKDYEKNNDGNTEGELKLSKIGVLWRNKSTSASETMDIIEDIKTLEKEKLYLESRVPELQSKIEVLSKHVQYKNAERSALHEKLDNAKLKYQSTENITIERRRQYEYLKNKASERVGVIRNSCQEKKDNIDELSIKLSETSERRQSYTSTVNLKESDTIQALEEQITILQERIVQLKSETASLYRGPYHNIGVNKRENCT